jgi:DNA-binding XRE family transcriptional regulator
MSKPVNRIESVRALDGMVIEARYSSGQVVHVDLTELAGQLAIFAPLKQRAVFERVAVEDWGHSVAWDDDANIGGDRLMEMAFEQQGRTDTVAFRRWQDRNHLSLKDAADAIGLTRRTISQYRTGARPVPRTVTLACKGWEAERRHTPTP